jgi:hypothetical protein
LSVPARALDWLGDEIGFAHGNVSDILEKAVVEEGPVPLMEYITILRKDKPSVFLGPSLTMPTKIFKKVDVKKTTLRTFLDVKRGGEEEEEAEIDEEEEEEEFNSMLKKRQEDLEEEERHEEEDLEEEEMEEEKKAKEEDMKKRKKQETDPEERRRLVHQGRRGGE